MTVNNDYIDIQASLTAPITQSFSLLTESEWQNDLSINELSDNSNNLLDNALNLSVKLASFTTRRVFNYFSNFDNLHEIVTNDIDRLLLQGERNEVDYLSLNLLNGTLTISVDYSLLRRRLGTVVIAPQLLSVSHILTKDDSNNLSRSFDYSSTVPLGPSSNSHLQNNGTIDKYNDANEVDFSYKHQNGSNSIESCLSSIGSSIESTSNLAAPPAAPRIDFLTFWALIESVVMIKTTDSEIIDTLQPNIIISCLIKFRNCLLRYIYNITPDQCLSFIFEANQHNAYHQSILSIPNHIIQDCLEKATPIEPNIKWDEISSFFKPVYLSPSLVDIGWFIFHWLNYNNSPLMQAMNVSKIESDIVPNKFLKNHSVNHTEKTFPSLAIKPSTFSFLSRQIVHNSNYSPTRKKNSAVSLPSIQTVAQIHDNDHFISPCTSPRDFHVSERSNTSSRIQTDDAHSTDHLSNLGTSELAEKAEMLLRYLTDVIDKKPDTPILKLTYLSQIEDILKEISSPLRHQDMIIYDSLEGKLQISENKRNDMRIQIEELEKRIEDLYESELVECRKVQQLQIDLKISETKIRTLEKDLDLSSAERMMLKSKLRLDEDLLKQIELRRSSKTFSDHSTTELDILKTSKELIEKDLNKLQSQVDILKQQLHDALDELTVSRADLNYCQNQLNMSRQECKQLYKKIEDLEVENIQLMNTPMTDVPTDVQLLPTTYSDEQKICRNSTLFEEIQLTNRIESKPDHVQMNGHHTVFHISTNWEEETQFVWKMIEKEYEQVKDFIKNEFHTSSSLAIRFAWDLIMKSTFIEGFHPLQAVSDTMLLHTKNTTRAKTTQSPLIASSSTDTVLAVTFLSFQFLHTILTYPLACGWNVFHLLLFLERTDILNIIFAKSLTTHLDVDDEPCYIYVPANTIRHSSIIPYSSSLPKQKFIYPSHEIDRHEETTTCPPLDTISLAIQHATYSGVTPLHLVAIIGQPHLFKYFIKNGAMSVSVDHRGNTPLHYLGMRRFSLTHIELYHCLDLISQSLPLLLTIESLCFSYLNFSNMPPIIPYLQEIELKQSQRRESHHVLQDIDLSQRQLSHDPLKLNPVIIEPWINGTILSSSSSCLDEFNNFTTLLYHPNFPSSSSLSQSEEQQHIRLDPFKYTTYDEHHQAYLKQLLTLNTIPLDHADIRTVLQDSDHPLYEQVYSLQLTENELHYLWTDTILNFTCSGVDKCHIPITGDITDISTKLIQLLILTPSRLILITYHLDNNLLTGATQSSIIFHIVLTQLQFILIPDHSDVLCLLCAERHPDYLLEIRSRNNFLHLLHQYSHTRFNTSPTTWLTSLHSHQHTGFECPKKQSLMRSDLHEESQRSNNIEQAPFIKSIISLRFDRIIPLLDDQKRRQSVLAFVEPESFLLLPYNDLSLLVTGCTIIHFGFVGVCLNPPSCLENPLIHLNDVYTQKPNQETIKWKEWFIILRVDGTLHFCLHPNDTIPSFSISIYTICQLRMFNYASKLLEDQDIKQPSSPCQPLLAIDFPLHSKPPSLILHLATQIDRARWVEAIHLVMNYTSHD